MIHRVGQISYQSVLFITAWFFIFEITENIYIYDSKIDSGGIQMKINSNIVLFVLIIRAVVADHSAINVHTFTHLKLELETHFFFSREFGIKSSN